MNLSYITNKEIGVNVKNSSFDSFSMFSQLPFVKRNYLQYAVGHNPIHTGTDLHFCRMYDSPRFGGVSGRNNGKNIRIYFADITANGTRNYVLESDSPDGEWNIITDELGEPINFIQLPAEWNTAAGYDENYGIGSLNFVYDPRSNATTGFFKGWCTVKYNNSYTTAYCNSNDGLVWTNFRMCNFDESVTSKFGSWRVISGSHYDGVERAHYGVIQGMQSSGGTGGIGGFVRSTDGINWSLVGMMPPLENSFSAVEASNAVSLHKIGRLWIASYSRYDTADGIVNKNPVWAYSIDGMTWDTWNLPFIKLNRYMTKYPDMYLTPTSMYMIWIEGGLNICLSKLDWVENPPITQDIGDVIHGTPNTKGFYNNLEGGKKAIVTVRATASSECQLKIDFVPVLAIGKRVTSSDWIRSTIPFRTQTLNLSSGTSVQSFEVETLPRLWNVDITSLSEGVTVTNIYLEIMFI